MPQSNALVPLCISREQCRQIFAVSELLSWSGGVPEEMLSKSNRIEHCQEDADGRDYRLRARCAAPLDIIQYYWFCADCQDSHPEASPLCAACRVECHRVPFSRSMYLISLSRCVQGHSLVPCEHDGSLFQESLEDAGDVWDSTPYLGSVACLCNADGGCAFAGGVLSSD